jgi:hypothetical protein
MDGTIAYTGVNCESITDIEANIANQTITANGEVTSVAFSGGITDKAIYLFAANFERPMLINGDNRIYAVKFYDVSGILTFDAIPVRKVNIGYMYDRVSGQLFGNQGTGEFVLGKDVGDDVEYTAKDYVQDGLVTMWDSIENGGFGVHNEGLTTITPWVDCKGGVEYASPYVRLMADGVALTDTYMGNRIPTLILGSETWTIELIGKFFKEVGPGSFIRNNSTFGAVSNSPTIFDLDNSTMFYVRCPKSSSENINISFSFTGDSHTFYTGLAFSDVEGVVYAAINGNTLTLKNSGSPLPCMVELLNTADPSTSEDGVKKNRIYSIRTYNRALTAEEIAHNYSIDKARFGL